MESTQSDVSEGDDRRSLVKNEETTQRDDADADDDGNVEMQGSCWLSSCAKRYLTVEPAIFATFLAVDLCDAVISNLIMSRVCTEKCHFNKTECDLLGSGTPEGLRVEALVQPTASMYITIKTLIGLILPGMNLLFMGPWSDRNGRKFLLLCSMIGLSASLSLYGTFSYFPRIGPEYVILASLPFSFLGGFLNLISAAYSYISDVSKEEDRALRLGVLESAMYVGSLVGMMASYRVFNANRKYGYEITFATGALIALAAFLYTLCLVPESVQRREVSRDARSPFQMRFLKEIFVVSFRRRDNSGRAVICLSVLALTTTFIAIYGEGNLMYLFARIRFGWNLPEFTTWTSVLIAVQFVGILVVCVVLSKIFKITDPVLAGASFLAKLLECVFFAFIPSREPQLMYWALFFAPLVGVAGPSLRSVLSKVVPKDDIGKVFSLTTLSETIFPFVFTPLYTTLYDSLMHSLPGAFFLLSASFYALNTIICGVIYYLKRQFPNNNNNNNYEPVEEQPSSS